MINSVANLGATALLASVLFSSALSASTYVSEGHEYKLTCNNNGYILRSRYPVTRLIEGGVASRVETMKHEEIRLGKDCDAYHKIFGVGKWCWANGGFSVEFSLHNFGFPRQELDCEPTRPFEGNCQC
jgi:hypothetical protein